MSLLLVTVLAGLASVGADRRTTYSCGGDVESVREPITSLLVLSSVESCPEHYEKINTNLNPAGISTIACITRGDSATRYGVPYSNLFVTESEKRHPNTCPEGSIRLSRNLNIGNLKQDTAQHVFFCTERFGVTDNKAVTDLTFVKNSETCPNGYEKSAVNINSGLVGEDIDELYACVERSCTLTLNSPSTLKFRPDKTFKIAQFTDSHFGEDYSEDIICATEVYRQTLMIEDPDLVALTGDQVSGYAWNHQEHWFTEMYGRVLDSILGLGYPYFYLLGNHDPQADLNQTELISNDLLYGQGVTFTQQGPPDIAGASNYHFPVYSSKSSEEVAYNFWVFDSNGYNCEDVQGYGCIEDTQINWYKQEAAALKEAAPDQQLPPALAFFHIPLDEYLLVEDASESEAPGMCMGRREEDICCSSVNTGVFQAFLDVGDVAATFAGHDHDNDYALNHKGITLHYGRKSGVGGYGPPDGWQRGSRISVLNEGQRGLAETWIRQQDGSRFDPEKCDASLIADQSQCCGMSFGNSSSTNAAMDVSKDLERQFKGKEDKCSLYEAAFRAKMAEGSISED